LGALALQWGVQAFELYQVTGSVVNHGNLPLVLLAIDQYNPQLFSEADSIKIASVYFGTMIGASGAVFGIMTAFAMLYPNVELYLMFIPVPVKAKYFIPIYIVIELFLGVARIQGDSVAHFAHLGGALIGFILVKLWKDKNTPYDYYG
jgi:membrane associated rhomboid family serine protease